MKAKEFTFEGFGTISIEFLSKNKRYVTSSTLNKDDVFFAKKILITRSPKQILIFQYGFRSKKGTYNINYNLRKDLKDNHLNFDIEINGRCANCIVPNNQKKKQLKNFFLHTIKRIPNKLEINISHLDNKKIEEGFKKIRSFNLKII
jgi:hypothetical protein